MSYKKPPTIYLASSSPRRKILLREHRIPFKILKPSYHEANPKTLGPFQLVRLHAIGKANSSVKHIDNGIILSADTLVYLDKKILGKPKNWAAAFKMLGFIQGKWHTVYTGVALLKVANRKITKQKIFVEQTKVQIIPMDKEGIKRYFKKVNPLDKAGAYAIQSKQMGIICRFKGSLTNAIGLPMERFIKELRVFI